MERCLQQKIGSCLGCNIVAIAQETFRWQHIPPEKAAQKISETYCPQDAHVQSHLLANPWASLAMGQERKENIIFEGVTPDPKGYKIHGRY